MLNRQYQAAGFQCENWRLFFIYNYETIKGSNSNPDIANALPTTGTAGGELVPQMTVRVPHRHFLYLVQYTVTPNRNAAGAAGGAGV